MDEHRLHCVVVGCRRTRGRRKGELPIRPGEPWCCGIHWRLVSPVLKRRRRALSHGLYRAWEKAEAEKDHVAADRYSRRWWRAHGLAWRLITAQATERAGGLG